MVGEISGVSVAVKYGDKFLDVPENGFLGEFDDSSSFQLVVTVSPEAGNILTFTVNGDKDIAPKRVAKHDDQQIYKLSIALAQSQAGDFFTPYPNNHLRLLLWKSDGQIQVWEIAIISQHGKFFLTFQKTLVAACYRDEDNVVMPEVKWPQLLSLLTEHLNLDNLPPISQFQKPVPASSENLKPGTARVKWFNFAMGVGAVDTPEGLARVHWSKISRGNGSQRNYLTAGELVSFKGINQLPKKKDGRQTAFQQEASGVQLIQ
ncbi:MAG: hypothetical protein COY66_04185 [Candidatus Kerfeldbacteria bacterium CG_4_10_14_0_8_um_filter_42_10]|uniref:CSD domain-containing protein n=1 Tax=Candidatus Kerfeldbacteria bacterium CG_4_10_14_0_8_um_filter_42_10 TaxID=2014248 RepID=A0A2M7RIV4_9BACT|nr:MAG: hypothetical protein COY66_04185 [Candidatus Kerfeldbacteria bacterium CG_4_10_14_0_8_um_filter_42_10]